MLQSKSLLPLESNELLRAVADLNPQELIVANRRLNQQGVFIQDTFAHPLYRELILQRLPKSKRQQLARRTIDFLGADPIKAVTFLEDADLEPQDALILLEDAIAQSKKDKNDLQTGKLLSKMLEVLPKDEQAKVALEAALFLKYVAVTDASKLAALAAGLDLDLAPKALLLQAELLAVQGHLPQATALWQTLEETHSQTAYLTGLVRVHGVAHDYKSVVEIFERCPECFEHADAATTHFIVRGLAQLGQLELAQNMITKVEPSTEDDLILLLKAKSDMAYTKSDFAEMERLELEIYNRAKPLGNLRAMDQALFNRALALEGLGRYEERKASLEEAMRVCQDLGDVTAYMIAQRAYGSLLADLGDYDRAEEYLLGARQYLESIDFYSYLLDCEMTLCHFYRESSRSYANVLALKHAKAALSCAARINNPVTTTDAFCTLALVQLDSGQIIEAEQSFEVAHQALQNLDLQQAQLTLQACKAHLYKAKGLHQEAKALFQVAIQTATEGGALLDQHRLGLELDRLNNNLESARARIQWFEERGLMNSVMIAKRLFPELAQEPQELLNQKQSNQEQTNQEPSIQRIDVLGNMQLVYQGVSENLRGRKRQELLAVLLEAKLSGRAELRKLEFFDSLYPDQDELKNANNLREMIHVLRQRLGINAVITTSTGYALGALQSDAELFLQTGDTSLWRGVYLEGITTNHQETVAESLYLLLFTQAQALLETNPKEAARVAKILLEFDPYHQGYLKLCLQALRVSSNHKSLTRLYGEAKEKFVEVGEKLPESWQEFLT